MSDLVHGLLDGILSVADALAAMGGDTESLTDLLEHLGASDPRVVDVVALSAQLLALGTASASVRELLAAPELSFGDAAAALEALRTLWAGVEALGTGEASLYPALGADLLAFVIVTRLRQRPLLFQLAVALGLVRETAGPPIVIDGVEVGFPRPIDQLVLSDVGALLRDPLASLRGMLPTPLLGTAANAEQTADLLAQRLAGLLSALGILWRYGYEDGDDVNLGEAAPIVSHALLLYAPPALTGDADAGLVVSLSPADGDDLGVVLKPFGTLNLQESVGKWTIGLQLSADIGAVAFGGGVGTKILADVDPGSVRAGVTAALTADPDVAGPAFRIGAATGTRLELGTPQAALSLTADATGAVVELSFGTGPSALVIARGEADGFLAELLPADGVRAAFDLGLVWSSRNGLTFRGAAGLDAKFPVRLAFGPVTLTDVQVALQAQADGRVEAAVSASLTGRLGPVSAAVDRVGMAATTTFPATGGNLGIADVALGFKPPDGVGLALDASVVTGGGFLRYDPAQGTYAGAMQLSLRDELTLTAFGLVTTRLPDGRPGYSLLVFITAEGFQPIPLGFGFVLQSIGGMVGVNRTFDQQVLTAGLRTGLLRTLLFPRDPVTNGPAIVQALTTAFPPQRGSVLLGLLARITWFTPPLLTMDLALILEVGARERLLVLGRISALLPSADNDLIRLQLDTVGVLDFDAGTLAVDAVLVDSRLLRRFPITGSAAVRARWGTGAGDDAANGQYVVLAVGGLNPRFAAPAGFPALERVTVALTSGSNPRLVCDAYFAITPNTVQFGARASLYAAALGFSVTGEVAFDALMTLVPPHFVVDFHASMQLKRGSHNLFKVAVDGTLEGPLPLHLSARAKFEILWVDFTVRFDFTLADGSGGATVPPVNLADAVKAALANPASWSTRRSPTQAHGVALRASEAGAGTSATMLDPLGQLVVRQDVAPLNLQRDVTTYGGVPVTGDRRFALTGMLSDQGGATVKGPFAPARYFTLSDDAQLAAPSFEAMDAGLVLGAETVEYAAPAIVAASLEYEPITLNPPNAASAPTQTVPYALTAEGLQAQVTTGAAARAPARRVGPSRFRGVAGAGAARLSAPQWRIVRARDGAAAPVDPGLTTWSEQEAALATLNRGGAEWQLVPAYEAP